MVGLLRFKYIHAKAMSYKSTRKIELPSAPLKQKRGPRVPGFTTYGQGASGSPASATYDSKSGAKYIITE